MRLLLIILLAFFFSATDGQKKPVKATTKSPVKPLKLKTFLGKNENGAIVTLDEALQLINFPLRITDINNQRVTILSYNFTYKRKAFLEDENTHKQQITFTTVGDVFKASPLPQIWRDNLTESLKKDEELFFFDIIIKDNQGRKTFAPELKIRIR